MSKLTILLDGSVHLDGIQVAKLERAMVRGEPLNHTYWVNDLTGKRIGRIERRFSRDRWCINHELPARHHTRESAVETLLKRATGEKGRVAAAEQALALYDFGPEKVVATGEWECRLRDCLHLRIVLETPQGERERRMFKVVFDGPGSSEVKEAFVMTPKEE